MMAAVMVTVMMVVEKEGVSVREPSNAANEFGQAVGEVGTRLPGKIQDVCLPMVSQWVAYYQIPGPVPHHSERVIVMRPGV